MNKVDRPARRRRDATNVGPVALAPPPRFRIAVLSGVRTDQGKTSAICDQLISPRLPNLIRIEVDHLSSGSGFPDVTRIKGEQLPLLRRTLIELKADENLLVDVGGSEYASFMAQVANYGSTTDRFDRIVIVMRAAGIKQEDAMDSIANLIDMGADPAKISVVFNMAPAVNSEALLEENLRNDFSSVFAFAEEEGFHIVRTPVIACADVYRELSGTATTASALAAAPRIIDELEAMSLAGQPISEEMHLKENVQSLARTLVKPNLDRVWAELMAVSQRPVSTEVA